MGGAADLSPRLGNRKENERGQSRNRVLYVAGRLHRRLERRTRESLGDGGERLFAWYFGGDTDYEMPGTEMVFRVSPVSAGLLRERYGTVGALVTGRRTFDITNG